ncbi:MAG: AsmA family protein, partial [Rhodoferax sp.]
MILLRTLKWLASAVLAIVIVAVLFVALFGWNWLRAPLERQVLAQTGRVLSIQGDLSVHLGWPWPRLQAAQVTFANPAWAAQANMLKADEVALSINLPHLLAKRLVVSDLHLVKPLVFLERHRDGRKTWLLDRQQQDENARIDIDRFTLDQGVIGFDDVASQTSLRAELSSLARRADDDATPGVSFSAKGKYQGLPLVAKGTGDSVLALRDDSTPYGLTVDATLGHTHVRAEGHITSLLKLAAIDMQLALSGDNLNQLFTLTGIAFPATRDYVTHGHLLRKGNTVRYES